MKIVCLANSFRMGGRCLGGIKLDQNDNPIFFNNRPKWVRPVCQTEHEEVPTCNVLNISLLDIIEFQPINESGHGHQSENVLIDGNSIKQVGSYLISNLEELIDNARYYLIFGNRGSAVPEYLVNNFNYSLMLLSLDNFETNERMFEGKTYPQIKLSFKFNGNNYNFPITDPSFLHLYGNNSEILQHKEKIYVTISLAIPHNEWSYKLIAGIMYDDKLKKDTIRTNIFYVPF